MYLKLNRLKECIDDCTYIIDNIYNDKSEKTQMENVSKVSLVGKSFVRRGTAYCHIGDYKRGLISMEYSF